MRRFFTALLALILTIVLVLLPSTASAAVNPAWVRALMTKSEPTPPPWIGTFDSSAAIIASVADELPVYAGDDGPAKTAALLVSIGWFESHFRPDAKGDCDKRDPVTKICVAGSRAHSFCMFQIHETNFASLGVTETQVQTDLRVCARSALRLVRISFRVCAEKPHLDRLDHYAAGGNGCRTPLHEEGRHRMRKGDWLFNAIPREEIARSLAPTT
jgi:hypothetical protein